MPSLSNVPRKCSGTLQEPADPPGGILELAQRAAFGCRYRCGRALLAGSASGAELDSRGKGTSTSAANREDNLRRSGIGVQRAPALGTEVQLGIHLGAAGTLHP